MKSDSVTPANRSRLREALLDHYDRAARDLPWRKDTDPYRVMVSEFMLQQTRVETVKGYYGPWLERFPTVTALAEADEGEVLKAWEGLGYYRRARNLHGAARVVRERFGGSVPGEYRELLELPGVGAYTAGAVASIAFGRPVPAVDGNVRRVFSRLFDRADPKPAWLREEAAALVDPERPGDWNQALMELGATVCTPKGPRCEACPVEPWCAARAAGTVSERPAPAMKRVVPAATIVLSVIHREDQVLLERRAEGGLLGGRWAFPEARLEMPASADPGARERANRVPRRTKERVTREAAERSARELASGIAREIARELIGSEVGPAVHLADLRHRFSHLDATYWPFAVAASGVGAGGAAIEPGGPDGARSAGERRWVTPAAASKELALPVAQQKVLNAWVEHFAE